MFVYVFLGLCVFVVLKFLVLHMLPYFCDPAAMLRVCTIDAVVGQSTLPFAFVMMPRMHMSRRRWIFFPALCLTPRGVLPVRARVLALNTDHKDI